jgi:hypothetical protein
MSPDTPERIRKLERLADRPGTPGEGPAAQAAIDRIMARLPIVGRIIERAKACNGCRSTKFKIEPGKGPHAHHLRCANCGRGGYWMAHAEAKQFEEKHTAGARS